MKGERIASVGPHEVGGEGIKHYIASFEDGHKFLGYAVHPEGIKTMSASEEKPTVIIVQDFREFDETLKAVRMAKALLPKVKVITFGVDRIIEEADYQLGIFSGKKDLQKLLLSIKH